MLYGVLATVIALAHLAYIVFVLGGALLIVSSRWWALLHIPAVLWGAYVELTSRVCPLTPLENVFRARAGQAGYSEGFIEHYLTRLIYPEGLTSGIQIGIGVFVLILNGALYWWVFHRTPVGG